MKEIKKKKGISLIVLVITILVIIILAVAVILTLANNNPIDNAKKAVMSNNIQSYKEIINGSLQKLYIEKHTNNNINNEYEEYVKMVDIITDAIPNAQIANDIIKVDDYTFKLNNTRTAVTQIVEEIEFTVVNLQKGDSDEIKEQNVQILNDAIINNKYIYISGGEYYLSSTIEIINQEDKYIKMSEDTNLYFPKQILDINGEETLPRVLIKDSKNIIFEGGNIYAGDDSTKEEVDEIINNDGWYNSNANTIYVNSGEKIFIKNMNLKNGRTAAIRIGGKGGTEPINGISVSGINVSDNYLGQGIAIVGASKVQVNDCDFVNVLQGIDIEPPNNNKVNAVFINDVVVDECILYGLVSQTSFYKINDDGTKTLVSNNDGRVKYNREINDVKIKNITVKSYESTEGNSIVLNGIYGIDIENVVVEKAKKIGISLREVKDIKIEKVNVSNSYNAGIQIYNPIANFNSGKIIINNSKIYNNECNSSAEGNSFKGAVNVMIGDNTTVEEFIVSNSEIYNNGTSGLRLSTIGCINSFKIDNLKAYGNGYNSNSYGILIEGAQVDGVNKGLIKDGVIKNSTLWNEDYPSQLNSIRIRQIMDTSIIKCKGAEYNNTYLEEKVYTNDSGYTLNCLS